MARLGKDVDDAAAHRELATVHHQVDARVGVLNQSARHVVERQLLALREDERIDVAEPLDNGLDQRTHRHDEYADRSEHRIASLGCVSLRNTAMRLATVSARGLSRSGAASPRPPVVRCRSGRRRTTTAARSRCPRPRGWRPRPGRRGVFRLRCGDGRAQPVRVPTVMIGAMSLPSAMLMPPLTSRWNAGSSSSRSRMPHREPSISAFWTRVAVAADALPRASLLSGH